MDGDARIPAPRPFAKSLSDAARGMRVAATDRNLRLQLVAAVAATVLAVWLRLDGVRVALVLGWAPLVLGAEVFNTAVERLADLVDDEHGLGIDPRLRDIKDLAAGAVLIVSLGSVLTGLLVLAPPLLRTLMPG